MSRESGRDDRRRRAEYLYTFDAKNRLVQAAEGTVELVSSTAYRYDGEGQRVRKITCPATERPCDETKTGAMWTDFVYDAMGNLAAEYASSGSQTETSGCGTPTCYLTADHLGSTRMLTDAQGNVKQRYDYLPFGEGVPAGTGGRTAAMGYLTNPDAIAYVRQMFTGQYRDRESALDYFNARYYSYRQGRFISPDPQNAGADPANPVTWNGYAYVGNNPLNITDPSGKSWITGMFAAVGFIGGALTGGAAAPWFYFAALGAGTASATHYAFEKAVNSGNIAAIAGAFVGGPVGLTDYSQPMGGNSGVFGEGHIGPYIFSFADQEAKSTNIDPRISQIPSLISRAERPAKAARPKWLNSITSIFGYDQNIPLPSCFGIFIKSTYNHINLSSPDISGAGEAFGEAYSISKYNQALRYAASTPSRTFGTSSLMYPNKSSVFRNLLKQSRRGNLAGLLFSGNIALAEGLYDEIQAIKQGRCQ